MAADEPLSLEYFVGGVPARAVLTMNVEELERLVDAGTREPNANHLLGEVCFIGLMSYFEAFCKDHFAAVVNICPELIANLQKSGHDTKFDLPELLAYRSSVFAKLGFLIAERFDFGSARKINSLYTALLLISPFGKADIERYDRLLGDRNLLVHHGGVYTSKYLRQAGQIGVQTAFMDSFIVTNEYFSDSAEFLKSVADKTVNATKAKLMKFVETNGVILDAEREQAVKLLAWDFKDVEDEEPGA